MGQEVEGKSLIAAVDLFCGAGGLTRGLERAGIESKLGVDVDPHCEYPFKANNAAKFALKSVSDVTSEELFEEFADADFSLLAGCAPCQPFSTYSQGRDKDARWGLLNHFKRLIIEAKPDLVTMENVPGLIRQSVFAKFISTLESEGYFTSYQVVNCADYGVPQQRKRLVLLASLLGPIQLNPPKRFKNAHRTVIEALGGLQPLSAGEGSGIDPLHQAASLSPLNLKRIKVSKQGGTWRDWPKNLVADCHKKSSGKTYPGVYGRMSWDAPSPTITTQYFGFGSGRFGHPEQNRAISLREGAILQSFPKSYRFVPPGEEIHYKRIGMLIGNAVPVKLGEVIGRSIMRHVKTYQADSKKAA
jgi:DNA (cytosine-5)-methyltransferase 1